MQKTYKEKRYENFREMICDAAKKFRGKTAFIRRTGDGKENVSYVRLKEYYYRLSTFLLDNGFAGARIAVTGRNCCEWVISYLAAATVGVAVPIDKELKKSDVEEFLKAAGCRMLISDGKAEAPECEGLVYADFAQVYSLASGGKYEFSGFSGENARTDDAAVDAIKLPKDRMQVLIFTSGTTGSSKGVCLSQYNICSNIHSTVSVVRVTPHDTTLSILPLHHTYECTLNCLLLLSRGACITYVSSLRRIAADIREYKPTILVVVPAVLKLLDSRIKAGIIKDCPEKYREPFETLPLCEALDELPFLVRRVIKSKVRATLGGRMRLFIVGAADLDTVLVRDFSALGIRTLQGYGLTECSPLVAGNSDFYFNAASTGIAIPGVQIKIDNPNEEGVGEILAKGDNVMLGYYNDEEATARVLRGGWFHTGDLGYMDEADGALYIRGRIKNVIVTPNGKNIYPEELETRLGDKPEIKESLVLAAKSGEARVKAKIFPDLDYLKERFGHEPSPEEITEAVKAAVADVNAQMPHYKHIDAVDILTRPLERTTTQKILRYGANVEQ